MADVIYKKEFEISGHEVSVMWSEADKQSNLFTPNHMAYDVHITIDDLEHTCTYQCNKNSEPNPLDILNSLVLDATTIDETNDMAEFLVEFGYNENEESLRKGITAYNLCLKTNEFFEDTLKDDFADFANEVSAMLEDDYER